MKSKEVIVCIDTYKQFLTINKSYKLEAVITNPYDMQLEYMIIDDSNKLITIDINNFITIQEHRNIQINKIL
jgi:hypothetical protein